MHSSRKVDSVIQKCTAAFFWGCRPTFGILAVAALAYLYRLSTSPLDDARNLYNLEHFFYYRLSAPGLFAQNWAYRLLLVLTALCIFAQIVRSRGVGNKTDDMIGGVSRRSNSQWAIVVTGALVAVAAWGDPWNSVIGALLTCLSIISFQRFDPFIVRARGIAGSAFLMLTILLSLSAWTWISGSCTALDLPSQIFVEDHFSWVLTNAERLAHGKTLGTSFFPYYGLLWPTVLTVITRIFGDLPWSFYPHTLGVVQLFISCGLLLLFFKVSTHPVLRMIGFLAITYFANFGSPLLYPNQSTFRYCAVVVVLWSLWLGRRGGAIAEVRILASCVFALIWNLETGIALTAGAVAYLLTADTTSFYRLFARMLRTGVTIVAMLMSALAVILALLHVTTGIPPSTSHLVEEVIKPLFSGARGLPLSMDFVALTICAGCLTHVMGCAMKPSALNHRARFHLACSCMCLVWLTYWVNRPHPLNLRLHILLFAFAVIPALRLLRLVVRNHGPWTGILPSLPVLMIYSPQIFVGSLLAASGSHIFSGSCHSEIVDSPPCFLSMSDYLSVKESATTVKRILDAEPQQELLLLTHHAVVMPRLVGREIDLPFGNPFSETFTPEARMLLLSSIRASSSSYLFVERLQPDDSAPLHSFRDAYFQSIVADLRDVLVPFIRSPSLDIYRKVPPTRSEQERFGSP